VRAYSRQELAYHAELIAKDFYCARPADIAFELLDWLLPKEKITTLDYSVKHRIIRKPGGEKTNWLPDLTPYLIPIMEALDNPAIPEIVVPKPARTGGTVVAENYALKMFDYGPTGDVMWYLKGPNEVASYADRVANPMFEDHAVGKLLPRKGSKGNTDKLKRVGAQTFELMQMSGSTTTNRQARFIVLDEPDSYSKDFRSNFIEQARQRQRMIGSDRGGLDIINTGHLRHAVR
jgi:phage terminase large subunit GpA-like protein